MDEKKQIEEMVKTAEKAVENYDHVDCPHDRCPYLDSEISCEGCAIIEAFRKENYCKQSEWISVDERLPKKEEIVLCCLGLVQNVYTYKGDNIWEDSYGYYQKDEPITHWMPLPEPPKMKGGAE